MVSLRGGVAVFLRITAYQSSVSETPRLRKPYRYVGAGWRGERESVFGGGRGRCIVTFTGWVLLWERVHTCVSLSPVEGHALGQHQSLPGGGHDKAVYAWPRPLPARGGCQSHRPTLPCQWVPGVARDGRQRLVHANICQPQLQTGAGTVSVCVCVCVCVRACVCECPCPPRVEMARRLEGVFKGLRFITSLRDTIRGRKGKDTLAAIDVADLIKFSEVRATAEQMAIPLYDCEDSLCVELIQLLLSSLQFPCLCSPWIPLTFP